MTSPSAANGDFLSVLLSGGMPIPIQGVEPGGTVVFTGHLNPDHTVSLVDPTTGQPIGTATFEQGGTVLHEVLTRPDGNATTQDVSLVGTSILYSSEGLTYQYQVDAGGPQLVAVSVVSDGELVVQTASGPMTVPAGSVVTYDVAGDVLVNGKFVTSGQPLPAFRSSNAAQSGSAVTVLVPAQVPDPADPVITLQDGSNVHVSEYVGRLTADIEDLTALADALDQHTARVNQVWNTLANASAGAATAFGNNVMVSDAVENTPPPNLSQDQYNQLICQLFDFQQNAPGQLIQPTLDGVFNIADSVANLRDAMRKMADQIWEMEQQNLSDLKNQDPGLQVTPVDPRTQKERGPRAGGAF